MGTRSTTKFIAADGTTLCALYRQWDGYPSGHGKELAEFIAGIRRSDGLGPAGTANGIQCLAAQVIAHFKTQPGDFYIVPPDQIEEWSYQVRENPNGDWRLMVQDDAGTPWYYGTPQGFLNKLQEAE